MNSNNAVGIIELSSLSKGFEVEDAVLKFSSVEKLLARSICSGKFLILVRGEIADIETCLTRAGQVGDFAVVQSVLIPRVDDAVFPAIAGTASMERPDVEGVLVLETFSAASAIKLADLAAKQADVSILRIHLAMAIGGKGLVLLTGDMESLKSALGPVLDFARDDGMLAGYALIPNPHPDLLRELI
ncbi:MAG TPA: BMC domain-containing protein [bacterium]